MATESPAGRGGPYREHITVRGSRPEVGKVTLKSNGDEVLSDESLLKSNSYEALLNDFP
jgi:hypothetical protein